MNTLKTEFKISIKIVVLLYLITFPVSLHSQILQPPTLFEPVNVDENKLTPNQKKTLMIFQQDNSTIDLRLVKIDISMLVSQEKTLRLDLFSGKNVTAVQEKVELRNDNGIRWFGYVPEQSSSIVFSAKGNAIAGYLFIGNDYYNVFPIGEGINALIHIDPTKHNDCGNSFPSGTNIGLRQPGLDINSRLANTSERSPLSGNPLNNKKLNKIDNINQTDTIVEVLVVYTSMAKTVTVNSNAQVYLKTDLVVDNGATLNINSGAKIRFDGPGMDLWVNNGAKLTAVGNPSQFITFTSAQANPGRKSWGTIFLHTSNNQLEYCTVESNSVWQNDRDGIGA